MFDVCLLHFLYVVFTAASVTSWALVQRRPTRECMCVHARVCSCAWSRNLEIRWSRPDLGCYAKKGGGGCDCLWLQQEKQCHSVSHSFILYKIFAAMYKVLLYVYSSQIPSTEITCITNLDGKFRQFSLEDRLLFLVALCSWRRFVVLHGIIMLIGCVISNGTRHTDMAVTSYWCSLFLTYTHVTMIKAVLPNL